MKRKTYFGIVVVLVLGLFLSACATDVNVTGQVEQDGNTATGSLNIDLGDNGNNSGDTGNTTNDGGASQTTATPVLSTQGLLVLVGLGLLVVIGLLLGLMRSKNNNNPNQQ